MSRRALAGVTLLLATNVARAATAGPDPDPGATKTSSAASPPGGERAHARDAAVGARPNGIAEIGVGILSLPGAAVCVDRIAEGCVRGDSSPLLEAWQLYRASPRLAFGAGLTLGLTTTTTPPRDDPAGFERNASRRYFTLEAIGRYYAITGETFELWLGLTAGLVVVSDSFAAGNDGGNGQKALVGPRADTIRTEGYAFGVASALAYKLAPRWSLSGGLRSGGWFLPSAPATNRLGDEASLTDAVSVFTLGIAIGYTVPL